MTTRLMRCIFIILNSVSLFLLPTTLVWRKDLRTCSEIIQTCISLDIPLDPNYGRKLVMLLLAPKQPQAITAKGRDAKKTAPSVEFKF